MKQALLIEKLSNYEASEKLNNKVWDTRIKCVTAIHDLLIKISDSKSSPEAKSFFYTHINTLNGGVGLLGDMLEEINSLSRTVDYYAIENQELLREVVSLRKENDKLKEL